jgi:hypothetical protein
MLNSRSGTIKVVVEVAADDSRMEVAAALRSASAGG